MPKTPTHARLEKKVSELEKEVAFHRHTAETLREDAERYRIAVEYSNDGFAFTEQGKLVHFNKRFLEIFGYDRPQDLQGKSISKTIHPDDRKRVMDIYNKRQKGTPVPTIYEFKGLRKDGKPIYIEISATITRYRGHNVNLSFLRDISSRRKAEDALRESEEKYRNLVETMNEGLGVTDEKYVFTYANQKFADMLGRPEDAIVGHHIAEFVAEDYQDVINRQINQRKTGQAKRYELVWDGKDGRRLHTLISPKGIFDPEGRFIGSFGVLTDITKLKLTEKALEESELRYRQLVKRAPTGIYEIDIPNLKFISVNDVMCEYTGYTREEILAMGPWDVLTEESLKDFIERQQKTLEGMQIPDTVEYKIKKKNGAEMWVMLNAHVVYEEGKPVNATVVVHDISDRKQAEEALRESEERFRAIFEQAAVGIAHNDPEGNFVRANQRFCDLLGYSHEQLNDLSVNDITHPDDLEVGSEEIEKLLAGKKQVHTMEKRFLRKNGTEMWGKVTVSLVRNGAGRPKYFIGILEDITEQKVMQAEKKRLEIQLRQAQKMEAVGTLAGGIAHDFNNILGAIIGYAEMLQMYDVPEDSPMRPNLDQVLKAGHRAKDLVKQILAFSRQSEKELKPVQLHPIVKEVIKFLRATLPATIEIRQQIDAATGAVLADTTQIHQVIMNLCTNAHHAMWEHGGILDVSLAQIKINEREASQFEELDPGVYLKISVSDTGHGMTPDILDRIFDPYFTTKEKGVGTGMGLAVVHGIIKRHKGAISVDSHPGKGTRFNVYIPVIEGQAGLEPEAFEPLPMGNERILFIDDELALADLGKQMLERLGYHVETRTSPSEACELFNNRPGHFDLVITDMTMPQMTGEELTKELIDIQPDIPVILCTGFSEKMSVAKARLLGIRGFLLKPITIRDLADTVRNVLDSK